MGLNGTTVHVGFENLVTGALVGSQQCGPAIDTANPDSCYSFSYENSAVAPGIVESCASPSHSDHANNLRFVRSCGLAMGQVIDVH